MPPLFLSPGERGNCYGAEACHAADDGRLFCRHYAGLCASQYIRADFFFYWLFHHAHSHGHHFHEIRPAPGLAPGRDCGLPHGAVHRSGDSAGPVPEFWGCRPDLGGGLPL